MISVEGRVAAGVGRCVAAAAAHRASTDSILETDLAGTIFARPQSASGKTDRSGWQVAKVLDRWCSQRLCDSSSLSCVIHDARVVLVSPLLRSSMTWDCRLLDNQQRPVVAGSLPMMPINDVILSPLARTVWRYAKTESARRVTTHRNV
jgi:hypothetical protein